MCFAFYRIYNDLNYFIKIAWFAIILILFDSTVPSSTETKDWIFHNALVKQKYILTTVLCICAVRNIF